MSHLAPLNPNNPSNPQSDSQVSAQTWLDDIQFNADGLIPAIAQDKATGEILMMAWMNRESLQLTAQTKTAVYYSRSRNKLWHKGESSGHTQIVHQLYLDCDADVILLKVTQIGNIACHTGRRSCFYRQLDLSDSATPKWTTILPVLKDPNTIYGSGDSAIDNNVTGDNDIIAGENANQPKQDQANDASTILGQLDQVLIARKQADANSSYVASLYAKGINKILEKVGEEAVESIIAAKDLAHYDANTEQPNKQTSSSINKQALIDDLIYETADVWFHTLVTLAWFNIGSEQILAELARRFGLSGIDEKNSRR